MARGESMQAEGQRDFLSLPTMRRVQSLWREGLSSLAGLHRPPQPQSLDQ